MTFQKVGLQEMLDSADPFIWLQGWYYALCNDDWEHGYGPNLTTLDNPGWHLKIELINTGLADVEFEKIFVERSEHDWLHCKKTPSHFDAHGGPVNLTEMLAIFREWANPHLMIREYPNIYGTGDEQ